jgi:hypothetical protein
MIAAGAAVGASISSAHNQESKLFAPGRSKGDCPAFVFSPVSGEEA